MKKYLTLQVINGKLSNSKLLSVLIKIATKVVQIVYPMLIKLWKRNTERVPIRADKTQDTLGKQFRNIYKGVYFSLSLIAKTGNNLSIQQLAQIKRMTPPDFERW